MLARPSPGHPESGQWTVDGAMPDSSPSFLSSQPAAGLHPLRSGYTMRTKCAISDGSSEIAFLRCLKKVQLVGMHVVSHTSTVRKYAISDERIRDCALCTHSVFRPLYLCHSGVRLQHQLRTGVARQRPCCSFEGGLPYLSIGSTRSP